VGRWIADLTRALIAIGSVGSCVALLILGKEVPDWLLVIASGGVGQFLPTPSFAKKETQ
jgi:hypothetical protein